MPSHFCYLIFFFSLMPEKWIAWHLFPLCQLRHHSVNCDLLSFYILWWVCPNYVKDVNSARGRWQPSHPSSSLSISHILSLPAHTSLHQPACITQPETPSTPPTLWGCIMFFFCTARTHKHTPCCHSSVFWLHLWTKRATSSYEVCMLFLSFTVLVTTTWVLFFSCVFLDWWNPYIP